MLRKFRKPLIIFPPKSLCRKKEAVSKLDDMGENKKFKKIIVDGENKNIKKVIFCSGKIFYDIREKINNEQLSTTLIIRIEQLYPFPSDLLIEELKNAKMQVFLVPRRTKNMGPWYFITTTIN